MIKLTNVSKSYYLGEEKVPAVSGISLAIKSKEYISILGPSGCGKSTLMYLIGLLETPTNGEIILDGKDVSQLSDDELSKVRNQHVGFIFQSFNLINKLTVLENVILPAKYAKININFNPQKRAKDLLRKFGIYHRRHFLPNKISGGEQQRTAIARSLIMNPKIILADEPTGNLDSNTGREILDILGNLNKDLGTTIIMVTHDPSVAKRTQRHVYMRDGKITKKYSWK